MQCRDFAVGYAFWFSIKTLTQGRARVKDFAKRVWNWLVTLLGIVVLAFGAWEFYPWSLYVGGAALLALAALIAWGRKPIFDFCYLRWHVPTIMRVTEDTTRQFEAELARRLPALPAFGGGGDMWNDWQPHLDQFIDTEIMSRLSPSKRELLSDNQALRKEVNDTIINMVLRRLRGGG